MIGASKMDEKILEEIRRLEAVVAAPEETEHDDMDDMEQNPVSPEIPPPTGQQTLFGGGE